MNWSEEEYAAYMTRLKTPPEGAGFAPEPFEFEPCLYCGNTKRRWVEIEGNWVCSSCRTVLVRRAPDPDRLEAPIQAECLKILEQDGWRILITNPCSDRSKGKGFGEIGMADAMAIRYSRVRPRDGYSEVLWIEFKRGKGGLLSKAQRAWHIRERARGAMTIILGEDCESSVEGWRKWYRASGLQRRGDL